MAVASEPDNTPLPGTVFTPRQVRLLKIAVIVMGILLVGGFALVRFSFGRCFERQASVVEAAGELQGSRKVEEVLRRVLVEGTPGEEGSKAGSLGRAVFPHPLEGLGIQEGKQDTHLEAAGSLAEEMGKRLEEAAAVLEEGFGKRMVVHILRMTSAVHSCYKN